MKRIFRFVATVAWVAVLHGCATYEPKPIDPSEVLARLESIEWEPPYEAPSSGNDTVGPADLAAFAVRTNPAVAEARAALGVRRALLDEAGRLPDPEVGWDAMDVIASQVIDGTSSPVDVLAGFGVMFPIPRPGELAARRGEAGSRLDEARLRLATVEWELVRDVHLAFEDVLAAERRLEQAGALSDLARSSHEYFERAREAGAATAIQANLALGELQARQVEGIRAEARVREAREALNAWLGLPPDAEIPLARSNDPDSDAWSDDRLEALLANSPRALTEDAVQRRPDLAARLARYEAAEAAVRSAVSTRFPSVALGTGIQLTLPIFSGFGKPATRTAMAERERLGAELARAVHEVRDEIATAYSRLAAAQREVELVESAWLPNAEASLELSREAFRAGEVTLLETVALQRALVEARTRHTEARSERAKSAWRLLAASGRLFDERTEQPDDRRSR